MRKFAVASLLVFLLAALLPAQASEAQAAVVVYVAADATAPGDGSVGSPFVAPQQAVNEVARRYNDNPNSTTHYFIKMKGGEYLLTEGIKVDAADFGGSPPPITVEPWDTTEVIISGLRAIDTSLFRLPSDPDTLSRIRPEVRGQVFEADLADVNIPNLQLPIHGVRSMFPFSIVVDGEPQPLSRFPNGEETLSMGTVLEHGYKSVPGIFEYKESIDRHEVWADAHARGQDIWLNGFWRVVWNLNTMAVKTFDKDAGTIEFQYGLNNGIGSKWHRPGGSGMEPYWLENLLEEIDAPGEWSIDFVDQKMYYLPPSPLGSLDLTLSGVTEALLTATDMSDFTVKGISFTGATSYAIRIEGGSDNLIYGCEIHTSLHGIALSGGSRNKAVSCDIYDMNGQGILVTGGTVEPRVSSGHEVLNNHIYNYAIREKIYNPAVNVQGVGVRVAHNVVNDAPHVGILHSGYDHIIEYNDISEWSKLSNDMGAIYSFLPDDAGGIVVRHNFAHNSPGNDGIYFDRADNNNQVYSNLVINVYRAHLFKATSDHYVRDNIAIDSRHGFTVPMTPGSLYERNVSINNTFPAFLSTATEEQQANTIVESMDYLGFVDAANGNYQVAADAPIFDDYPTFAPIDFARVGFYADEFRDGPVNADVTGDVNCDGRVLILDAYVVSQAAVGLRSASTCPLENPSEQYAAGPADANNDGIVNILDAYEVARCAVGLGNCN